MTPTRRLAFSILTCAALGTAVAVASAQERPAILGRWDVTVREGQRTYPSWFEVTRSGYKTLVGQYVAEGGSARPISQVHFSGDRMHFTVPVQWERGPRDIRMEGRVSGDRITGTLTDSEGKQHPWTAERAPSLQRTGKPQWGAPIQLFNGRDLTGWQPRNPRARNGWTVEKGILRNAQPGNDLVTTRKFDDFKIRAEFRYPKGSNSGLYLRGRYEVQIEDNYGREPESHLIGGIYGYLTPRVNSARPAGEWQTYDITLVGRRVTIVLNGETVIDRQEIPGITGGALDSREGDPGPIMLQGDHGPVEFRKLVLTPAVESSR